MFDSFEQRSKGSVCFTFVPQCCSWHAGCPDLVAYEVQGVLGEVEQTLPFIGELVDFSRSFAAHVPLAFHVAFFLQGAKQWIDSTRTEVNPKGSADLCDDLISMHGCSVQELEDDEV